MSVASLGASTSAYSYLQSLLPQQSTSNAGAGGAADPVTELLQAFYPAGSADPSSSRPASSSGASPPAPAANVVPFSPDTMRALISIQGQQRDPNSWISSQSQALFGQFDANGDGQISKSEFENVFGSGADMAKVDGLFNALDANGDGSISQDELTSAAEQSHAHHHHHHHVHGMGGRPSGALADLMSPTDLTGATSKTSANSDGSTTTTITYADGSTVAMTTPAASSGSGSSGGGSGGESADANLLQSLIRLQAQLLSPSGPGHVSAA